MTWQPGQTITRRDVFAVLLEPGSKFTFHDHPFGPHPWGAHPEWGGRHALQIHRRGDLYSVWKFFEDDEFLHWYVNFESAVVRHEDSFDTDDWVLPRGQRYSTATW